MIKRMKLALLVAMSAVVVAPIALHAFVLTLGTAMTTSSITWWWQ